MAVCPLCQADVPDDFGLIECSACGAPLLVHMDGRVEHSGEGSAGVEVEPAGFEFGQSPAEVEIDLSAEAQEPTVMNASTEFAPVEAAEDSHELDKSFHFAESEQEASQPEEVYSAARDGVDPSSPDLSDIARFGNSEVSLREGSLRYQVLISGIDTADVREAFREAITDRKMMWDVDEILRSIKNGEVELKEMSAVKAFIIISRLRSLPVQIHWEQYAVAQT